MSTRLELPRRGLILGAAALVLTPRVAFAAPGKLAFAVYRNGTKIGEHEVSISGDEANPVATAEVQMTVKVGPVPVFKYHHRATERWRGGQFASIETWTDQSGKKPLHVVAQATPGGVMIEGGVAGPQKGPANAAPLTHWNTAAFSRPLFNQQEGKFLKVNVSRLANNHFAIRGETEIDDFYDAAGQWQSLKGKLDDGSTMEYRRL